MIDWELKEVVAQQQHEMGDFEIHEDDMPIGDFSVLTCFKMKEYDALAKIDENDLPLGGL